MGQKNEGHRCRCYLLSLQTLPSFQRGEAGADTQKQPRMPATALGVPCSVAQLTLSTGCWLQLLAQCQRKMNSSDMICNGNWSPYPWTGEADAVFAGGCSMVEFATVC
eukprot:scaffold17304_cov54-Cyclotella_meneghiniana.AAC.4